LDCIAVATLSATADAAATTSNFCNLVPRVGATRPTVDSFIVSPDHPRFAYRSNSPGVSWIPAARGRNLDRWLTGRTPLSADEIKTFAGDARRVIAKLAKADATLKAELYSSLGVRTTYLPRSNEIELVARPVACATGRVGGAITPLRTRIELA